MATVLALDLATTTGWAEHGPDMPRPFFGAFKLPGKPDHIGERADALERWLRDRHKMRRFTHFVFEAQHVAEQMNIDTVYMLIALGGIVEKFAYQVGAKCYKMHIATWRTHFIGRGSGFKRDRYTKKYLPGHDPKQLAIATCEKYGWHTNIADAAEACGILDTFLTMVPGHPRPWRDNAMMGGAMGRSTGA